MSVWPTGLTRLLDCLPFELRRRQILKCPTRSFTFLSLHTQPPIVGCEPQSHLSLCSCCPAQLPRVASPKGANGVRCSRRARRAAPDPSRSNPGVGATSAIRRRVGHGPRDRGIASIQPGTPPAAHAAHPQGCRAEQLAQAPPTCRALRWPPPSPLWGATRWGML